MQIRHAPLAEAVEYTDWTSAEVTPKECDIKQSDGEARVMLEL